MLYCDAVTESVQLLTVQKPINRPDWWKGKFALFLMLATGGGGCRQGGGHLFKGRLPSLPKTQGVRAFTWFCIFCSAGQVLLSALSWCSARASVSENVFLMYSTSTDSSAIFKSLSCPTSSPLDISVVTSLMNMRFLSYFSLNFSYY